MAAGLLGAVERKVLHQERPRTDETHVAVDDVPQRRQLVEGSWPAGTAPVR